VGALPPFEAQVIMVAGGNPRLRAADMGDSEMLDKTTTLLREIQNARKNLKIVDGDFDSYKKEYEILFQAEQSLISLKLWLRVKEV